MEKGSRLQQDRSGKTKAMLGSRVNMWLEGRPLGIVGRKSPLPEIHTPREQA